METKLPVPKAVKDMFDDLLGRSVTVSPADPMVAEHLNKAAVAILVNDRMKMSVVIAMDLPLAASVAAAIGLVPPGGAEAAVEDGELSPMLAENCAEVYNIMTGLFNHEGAPHLKLHETFMPGEAQPADARNLLLAFGNRLDLEVAVSGYGKGRIAVSIA